MPRPENLASPTLALAVAMFFGCIGALFSALPSLSQLPEIRGPYNVNRQQALLKVVAGPWSALIGLLAVNVGLVGTTGSSQTAGSLTTIGGLVVMAIVFGAGQEAVTRFADNKAGSLLGSG